MDTPAPQVRNRLLRCIKMLRIPRLFALLNVDRIKQSINDFYNKRLNHAVQNNIETEGYPILRALMLVQLYKIFRLVILIFASSYFVGIFWHIFVCDIQSTVYLSDGSVSTVNFADIELGGCHSD